AAASGTCSAPPSATKSFCMSTTISALRAGSRLTVSATSYSGTCSLELMSFAYPSTGLADRVDELPLAHLRTPRNVALLGEAVELLAVAVLERMARFAAAPAT